MQWAATVVDRAWDEDAVRRLPVPWESVGRVVRPMGGQQIMTIAAPGVGKSTFAVNWAARSGARTLYASADTDERLMTRQLASLATGHHQDYVEARLMQSAQWRLLYGDAVRQSYPNLVFDFERTPSLDRVAARAVAMTEAWGETPELIVLDTASNLSRRSEDYAAWRELWVGVGDLARYFNSCVMVAHHVKEGAAAGGTQPPSLNDGKYGAHEFCEIVLGLHRSGGAEVTVSVLKNRGGKSQVRIPLAARYEFAALDELPREELDQQVA